MANLISQIEDDLKKAAKEKDLQTYRSLNFLISVIKNKEKEKFYQLSQKGEKPESVDNVLDDGEIVKILQSEAKKRKESIGAFEKGGRQDLAEKEKFELDLISKYLPKQMAEEELEKIIVDTINSLPNDKRTIGFVIKEVMQKVQGRADGSLVAKIVKEKLI